MGLGDIEEEDDDDGSNTSNESERSNKNTVVEAEEESNLREVVIKLDKKLEDLEQRLEKVEFILQELLENDGKSNK